MYVEKLVCVLLIVGVSAGGWEPLGAPYFDNSTRREATAAVGQPAYLHCRVRNLADRAVSWIRKRDLHILTVGVHTYSSDARFAALHADGSDEWTLRVAPAQPRDSGGYECQVSTEPKISLSFRLTVVVSKAEILAGPELFVRAGSDINLTCIARHAPDPPSFIYWYRGSQVVNYAQRGGISVETEQRTRTSRLLIARASPQDSGNYTCAPSSSDSASIVVHVLSGERPAAMQSSGALLPRLAPATLLVASTSIRAATDFIKILSINLMVLLTIFLRLDLWQIIHFIFISPTLAIYRSTVGKIYENRHCRSITSIEKFASMSSNTSS